MKMIRKIFLNGLVAILLLSPFLGLGQIRGGIKAGPQLADIIITNDQASTSGSYNSMLRYHFGSYVESKFTNSFGWKVEALFSAKGYSDEQDDTKEDVHTNYLVLPVMIVYYLNDKIAFETGLEPGFMIAGNERFQSFDMGMNLGVQLDINENFAAGIRYNQGFPFQMKSTGLDFNEELPSYQHSVIQLSLVYNFLHEREKE